MNPAKKTIGWCDMTWNPVTGCKWGCWYCYAKRMLNRFHRSFEPTFYPERLNDPDLNLPAKKVFVCSVADLFAPWTKPEWREAILNELPKHLQHTFQLLTKQPQDINLDPDIEMNLMKNTWIGTTITCDNEMSNLYDLVDNYRGIKFLSFEPLLGPVLFDQNDGYFDQINWVIIGKLTGSKRVKLDTDAVRYIVREAKIRNIPVFIKDNIQMKGKIQEFPKGDN